MRIHGNTCTLFQRIRWSQDGLLNEEILLYSLEAEVLGVIKPNRLMDIVVV